MAERKKPVSEGVLDEPIKIISFIKPVSLSIHLLNILYSSPQWMPESRDSGEPYEHIVCFFLSFFKRYLFIWLYLDLVVAYRLSCPVACGIFPCQGSNPHPLHCKADSIPLGHRGSPSFSIF